MLPGPLSGVSVHYIVESGKSFHEATVDLEAVVPRLGFVILHAHDLGGALRGKGIDFDDECKVFEVGNYRQMEKMLAADLRLSLALPWRISVFTENGATKIGLLRPAGLLALLFPSGDVARLAGELEEKAIQIVDETR
jgi:uncharacterized protein (DUF302 family)